jgi:hypothetical protein
MMHAQTNIKLAPDISEELDMFTFESQSAQRRPLTMKTTRSFETSGPTRPMTRLSQRGRTALYETQISNCWTWFILTLHESAGTRDTKTLLTRCGVVQTSNIDKYYIHSLHTN